MVNGKTQINSIVIIGVFLFVVLSGFGFGLIKGNDSELAFISNTETGIITTRVASPTLRDYLIDGAATFLDSYANALSFLREIEVGELQGLDFSILRKLLNSAVANIQSSNIAYQDLKNLANITPYNCEVILELVKFKYIRYMRENELNREVFRELTEYLQFGDIRGAYGRMLQDTVDIIGVLNNIKLKIDANIIPEGSLLWRLNQYYSESLLFGQYMAGVFAEINK